MMVAVAPIHREANPRSQSAKPIREGSGRKRCDAKSGVKDALQGNLLSRRRYFAQRLIPA